MQRLQHRWQHRRQWYLPEAQLPNFKESTASVPTSLQRRRAALNDKEIFEGLDRGLAKQVSRDIKE